MFQKRTNPSISIFVNWRYSTFLYQSIQQMANLATIFIDFERKIALVKFFGILPLNFRTKKVSLIVTSLMFSCLYLVSNTRSTAFSFRVYLAAKDFQWRNATQRTWCHRLSVLPRLFYCMQIIYCATFWNCFLEFSRYNSFVLGQSNLIVVEEGR